MKRLPTLFIPHGGGPCFFMEWNPKDAWEKMAAYLRSIRGSLPAVPKSLLVISGHWEERVPTVTTSPSPTLLYDYSGFPPSTYQLKWPAPADPALSAKVGELLRKAGIPSAEDSKRGFDHGVFIPLKVAFPEAEIPTVQLSLKRGLDPAEHLAIGRALAPLRDEGTLILGSGMSYHNMGGFMTAGAHDDSARFDGWLSKAVAEPAAARDASLIGWAKAPAARASHPREEHLIPLMVAAGAAGEDRGVAEYHDEVMGASVMAARFG